MQQSVADRIEVVVGDITKLTTEAVVTAANEALCGGGGVDGAIHRAAGPGLLAECLKIGHCPPGAARITGGYLLPAQFIIHTVGPVWEGGGYGEADVLASCYRASLALAAEHKIRSIALPCIATGVYGYPSDQACDIAVGVAVDWLREQELPERLLFCCFSEKDAELYRGRIARANENEERRTRNEEWRMKNWNRDPRSSFSIPRSSFFVLHS